MNERHSLLIRVHRITFFVDDVLESSLS